MGFERPWLGNRFVSRVIFSRALPITGKLQTAMRPPRAPGCAACVTASRGAGVPRASRPPPPFRFSPGCGGGLGSSKPPSSAP